ncbi:unnamed protein product, partial [Polarella glacialis]
WRTLECRTATAEIKTIAFCFAALAARNLLATMGTPSGAKNQTLFMDRLFNHDVRDFDGHPVQGPGVEGNDQHLLASNEIQNQMNKAQKHSEGNEFRLAASGHRMERKLGRVGQMANLAVSAQGPAAPSLAKKRLPSFVKLKSKDDASAEEPRKPDEADKKRQRVDVGDPVETGVPAPAASPESATGSIAGPSPAASLLGGYESSEDEEEGGDA